ncbi:hypothetical protein RvY_10359 [Ramazzottius varieornatus]|uniref:LSM12 LSM domain-containing protein n=1 Tax=Ramazzottius varieornatus TaxID=947166 RepID=A0A1D1VEL2_RAMVA|nr:hypothetical protein RvY_10359 [Ramazzottius varieornatus]
MAISLDYLNPGSEVRIVTSLKHEIVGEVIVCDGTQRMLLLKSRRPNQPPETHDLRLINMNQVISCELIRDVEVDGDQYPIGPETAYIELSKLENRLKQKLAERSQRRSSGNNYQEVPSDQR